MLTIEKKLETDRIAHVLEISDTHKKTYAQYFTPYLTAQFMASLFPVTDKNIKLLDPGAGIGVLSCAFLERIINEKWKVPKVDITAYDVDATIYDNLRKNILIASDSLENFRLEILKTDFLGKTSCEYEQNIHKKYTHIIMNPPYKKIQANSKERLATYSFGFRTVNLYSAFLGASIALAEKGGYIVAITPRSFCNGVYYKPFRQFIINNCSIKHIHLFESRSKTFEDESILQENIIIMLQKETEQKNVTITYSKDATFEEIKTITVPFNQILNPKDPEKYFNIPMQETNKIFLNKTFYSLKQLGVQVSTGPLVDFRFKSFLCADYKDGIIPLVYPVHFRNYKFDWPKKSKKPNAIAPGDKVNKLLFPKGYYVLIKRFSTKEEKQRVIASIITPDDFVTNKIAFENHLNVLHIGKTGLSEKLALGLVVWLNTSYIDDIFRLFSGHTQVNATDIRNIPYPSLSILLEMGNQIKSELDWNQALFDSIVEGYIS